jgi:hypothetical protein
MRKYQKAAVVVAVLGSVGFAGAGVGQAAGDPQVELKNSQSNQCGQENLSGILNISRVQVNILAIPVASPQDFSHNTTCVNGHVVGGH